MGGAAETEGLEMARETMYAILSQGSSNSYGGGGGEVVAVVAATSRKAALKIATDEGVEFYRGQWGEAVPSSRWTREQHEEADLVDVLVQCSCGRTIPAWTAAGRTGHCTHEARL